MSVQRDAPVRFLVVAEADRHDSVAGVLEADGMRVRPVGSAVAALSALSERPFDAVVCSLELPGDGLSLLREIRTFDEELPLIALTADARVGEAFEEGATTVFPS